MDTEKQAELVRLYIRADEAANALLVQAIEVYEMTKRIEDLTKDTLLHYAGLRARVEARGLPSSRLRTSAERWRRWVRSLEARRKGAGAPTESVCKDPGSLRL